ncbi:hypothetical protein EWM64_g2114, partial [Hericium alpestre]
MNIPSVKLTHAEIINLWYQHLRDIKKWLNNDTVKGTVSLTCDGWQASNVDAYFAMMAHWIEEGANGTWKLQSALIRFTRLNSTHSGLRLGQALYKVALHVGVVHKIGHVSCDNASNNGTMMAEFARLIHKDMESPSMGKIGEYAMQAMLRTQSTSKHFDPFHPDDHIPAETDPANTKISHNMIGLVHAICVKVCMHSTFRILFTYLYHSKLDNLKEHSSSKCKAMFGQIQEKMAEEIAASATSKGYELAAKTPLSLLLDMPVWWSSTYTMLVRAYKLCK